MMVNPASAARWPNLESSRVNASHVGAVKAFVIVASSHAKFNVFRAARPPRFPSAPCTHEISSCFQLGSPILMELDVKFHTLISSLFDFRKTIVTYKKGSYELYFLHRVKLISWRMHVGSKAKRAKRSHMQPLCTKALHHRMAPANAWPKHMRRPSSYFNHHHAKQCVLQF